MIRTSSPKFEEMPFILDSWIASFRKSPWAGVVTNDRWHEVMSQTLTALLPSTKIIVATPGDDAIRRIIGYIAIAEPSDDLKCPVIHYGYVKQKFRGLGVAQQLLEAASPFLGTTPGVYTFRTKASSWLEARGWKHDPAPARLA